jgi:hypothetical protein
VTDYGKRLRWRMMEQTLSRNLCELLYLFGDKRVPSISVDLTGGPTWRSTFYTRLVRVRSGKNGRVICCPGR